MVGVLVQSFDNGVQESTVFNIQQKTTIEQAVDSQVQATAVSDEQLQSAQ